MIDLRASLEEDQRLALLRVLSDVPGFTANDSVLHVALDALGHVISRDQVRGLLAWLHEQNLVTVEDGKVMRVILNGRGLDIAKGRAEHPGVKRPRPD